MRIFPLVLAVMSAACEAKVVTECVAGDCTPYTPEAPPDLDCYALCDIEEPSFTSGEYPCAVDAIMDNCRRCHVPGGTGPFSLDTYADAQQIYFGRTVWSRMANVVASDFMPLDPPKLTDEEKEILLDDWACICAPPRPAGEVCP